MRKRTEIWNIILVVAITLLVWLWAASETRDTRRLTPTVRFLAPDPDNWIVRPAEISLNDLTVEGSRLALDNAAELTKQPLEFTLGGGGLPAATEGLATIDLESLIANYSPLRETGARILTAEPSVVELDIDRLIEVNVPIRANLAGIETQGEISISPPEATLRMPSRLWQSMRELTIDATIEPWQLGTLVPGEEYTVNAHLRRPQALADHDDVWLETRSATITFTARSRIEEYTLDAVRVQIQSPPEDFDEYRITIDEGDRVLRNVTVQGESDLIERIAGGTVKVMAVVQLSTQDKDNRIERKPLSSFLAIYPDGRIRTIDALVDDSAEQPIIHFDIEERVDGES